MNVKRFKILVPHLRTICSFPDYAEIIKNQAKQESFDVRKEDVSRTTIFSSYSHMDNRTQSLIPKNDGKVKVLKPQVNKDVK